MRQLTQVANRDRGTVLTSRTGVAESPWSRLVGLLGRSGLPLGEGLLLAPASSIHTFFMRFPIDIAFLDQNGRVLKAAAAVPPFRIVAAPRGTRSVLELPAGTLAASRTAAGDTLDLRQP